MSDRYQRVDLLLSQHRNDMAERELRLMLADDPRDATAHALLALCIMSDTQRLDEATKSAQTAIGMEPDQSFNHYALAAVLLNRNHYGEAEAAIKESLRLDPYDPDAFAVLSQSYLSRKMFRESLTASEQGLAMDPEHLNCGNLRAISLERLGRGDEAIDASAASLRQDPDQPMSHAAHGFTLLNAGRHKEAQVAFREALRLDPNNEVARGGMVNALHSRSFLFRVVYKYYAFMNRLNDKSAMMLIFGAWIFVQILQRVIVPVVPWIQPFVLPLILLYILFVVLSWIASPLFNTFLRFHPFGQHLLTRSERWASNLLAPSVCLCVFGVAAGIVVGDTTLALFAGAYWLGLAIPIAATFSMQTKQSRWLVGAGSVVVGLLPVLGIARTLSSGDPTFLFRSFQNFGMGILAIQIASTILAVRTNRL